VIPWGRFTARHPEWWVVALAAAAAVVLLAFPMAHGVGAHHAEGGMAGRLSSWTLMTMAMMLPVFVPRARRVARTSIGRIRNRAIAETVAGYLAVWLAVGAGVIVLVHPGGSAGGPGVLVAAWVLPALWQCTRVRYRALHRCHAVGSPPGTRDGRRRVLAGMAYGRWCAITCGPAMAAAAVTDLPPALMGALAAGLLAERIAQRPRTASLRLAAAMAAGALVAAGATLA
jgi:hypothetical protein